jgi:uncharacterized RDD family membrane protein YckC
MNVRSKLDEIEDLNFAVEQIVYKGKHVEEVRTLLQTRGVEKEQEQVIINTVEETYKGIRRIESSKTVRAVNFIIDTVVLIVILSLILFSLSEENVYTFILIILFTLPILYYIIPEFLWGQTFGKFITGSIVVNELGETPNVSNILLRTLGRLIPYDQLSIILSERALHDRIAKTYVVNKKFLRTRYKRAAK